MDTTRPEAEADRDAELDEALRQVADELFEREIPKRLLRALRAAADAARQAEIESGAERRHPSDERLSRTRGE